MGYGWNKFRDHLGQILLAVLIVVAVNIGLQAVGFAVGDSLVLSLVLNVVGFVVTALVSAGIARTALDITEGKQVEGAKVLNPPNLPQVLIYGVITGIAVTVGLILCVLPGLAVLLFTAFGVYFLVDKPGVDAVAALTSSFNLVKDNIGPVLLWALTCFGLVLAGALACGVGLLVTLPIVYIGSAFTYKKLTGQPVAG